MSAILGLLCAALWRTTTRVQATGCDSPSRRRNIGSTSAALHGDYLLGNCARALTSVELSRQHGRSSPARTPSPSADSPARVDQHLRIDVSLECGTFGRLVLRQQRREEASHLDGVGELELLEDAGPMVVHGALAQAQRAGELLARVALRDQLRDLALA